MRPAGTTATTTIADFPTEARRRPSSEEETAAAAGQAVVFFPCYVDGTVQVSELVELELESC